MNNLHKYVIMALLGAACLINIVQPINAITIYPKSNISTILQQDDAPIKNTVLPHAKGYVDRHNITINFFNITYINNSQPINNNDDQSQRNQINAQLTDVIIPSSSSSSSSFDGQYTPTTSDDNPYNYLINNVEPYHNPAPNFKELTIDSNNNDSNDSSPESDLNNNDSSPNDSNAAGDDSVN